MEDKIKNNTAAAADGQQKLSIKEFLDQDEQKDLLRFLTAGSVDDGKSTLIGRLLFDSKNFMKTSWPPSSATASAWATPAIILTTPCCVTA